MARSRTKRDGVTPEAQQELPGVLPQVLKLPNLTKACRKLEAQRTALGELRLEMGKTKESIERQMIEAEVAEYPFDGRLAVLKKGKTVIVIKGHGDVEANEDDETVEE